MKNSLLYLSFKKLILEALIRPFSRSKTLSFESLILESWLVRRIRFLNFFLPSFVDLRRRNNGRRIKFIKFFLLRLSVHTEEMEFYVLALLSCWLLFVVFNIEGKIRIRIDHLTVESESKNWSKSVESDQKLGFYW